MKQVPEMISTKDLSYLEDMFNWNYTLYKKLNTYVEEVEKQEIKDFFEEALKNEKKILESIIKILG